MKPIRKRKRFEPSRRRLNGLNVLNVTAQAILLALLTLSPLPFTRSGAAHAAATGCGFPGSLDSFTDVVSGQTLTAALFNKVQCGVEKLETAVNGTANVVVLSGGALTLASPFIDGSQFYAPDSGSTDAYVATRNKPATAYVTGMWVFLKPNTVNTGEATLNLDGLGVKIIKQHDGTTLTNGMLAATRCCYHLIYDGTDWRLVGTVGSGSGTVSGTTGKLAKFTSSTAVGDSLINENGTALEYGTVSGNHHVVAFTSPTGTHTHTWPAVTGDVAQTTGSLVTGNCGKFDSSGRIIDHGSACGGSSVGTMFVMSARNDNVAVGTFYYNPVGHDWTNHTATADAAIDMPAAGTARNLYARINSNSVPASETLVLTLMKNGSATALTCSMAATTSTCSDTSNTVSFAAGDTWTMRSGLSGGATAVNNLTVSFQVN